MFMLIDFRFLFRYNSVNDWLNFPSGPCSQNGGLSVGGKHEGKGKAWWEGSFCRYRETKGRP